MHMQLKKLSTVQAPNQQEQIRGNVQLPTPGDSPVTSAIRDSHHTQNGVILSESNPTYNHAATVNHATRMQPTRLVERIPQPQQQLEPQQRILWVVPEKWAPSATSTQSLASHFADLRAQSLANLRGQPWWQTSVIFVENVVMSNVNKDLEWLKRRDGRTVVAYASYAATGDRIPDMDVIAAEAPRYGFSNA